MAEKNWIVTDCCTAGVDEAGRGPLAGPVVAAAVILDPDISIPDLDDSKKLSAAKRDQLFQQIQQRSRGFSVRFCEATEIDQINILQATLLAMKKAVESLHPIPTKVLIDGNQSPDLLLPTELIVRGDQTVTAISAASILAKVTRDRIMLDYHQQYPQYGFDCHKGYPTRAHLKALKTHGPCPIHRRSFGPVRRLLNE
ncbi:MAG: ribonuclease HII [Gammaproteobacteria bacterium]|nr:MAG: ribonuclease HII [Gammaproteobacteria bacterium]